MNNLDLDAFDDLPTREAGPIRRMGYNAKIADGPRTEAMPQLRRFLNSKVGQEWDLVYLLICDKAKYSAVPEWTLDRVKVMVEFDCAEQDGRVYDTKGNLVESWGRPEFYTCGGILKRAPQRPKYVRSERVMPTEGLNYYEIDGAFFEVYFRKFAGFTGEARRLPIFTGYDVLTKQRLTYRECEVRYGGLISWKKRQLSKREIRRLGLRTQQGGTND
jgi:hypothetical protein